MNTDERILLLKQLAEGIAVHAGPCCEVAVHDLTHGVEGSIVVIENGRVTGRCIGGTISKAEQKVLEDPENIKDQLAYLMHTQDGRLLKSSSMYIKDEAGRVVALFSIHHDITEISHAASVVEQFIHLNNKEAEPGNSKPGASNVDELLDALIEASCKHIGKPVALMNREDKIRAIQFLKCKGAFLIKKSGDRVARFYGISKYTLYNYMDEGIPR